MFTCLLGSSYIMPTSTTWDMAIISKTGPTIVMGLPKLRVLMQNPSVRSAPPKANRARDKETQRMTNN
jgi:hypothetical protein